MDILAQLSRDSLASIVADLLDKFPNETTALLEQQNEAQQTAGNNRFGDDNRSGSVNDCTSTKVANAEGKAKKLKRSVDFARSRNISLYCICSD